ncbi:sulfotransferase family 2 domain-containing protein [Ruegeria lacuscaerulensis]|uniref:sulfotransferase family 2 domain-containing protein n=1 Tax=Ruegeria lacuscaerulensis TaxID=55218 RepID=UPI001479C83B|nr:sulfotransferase family 2 domain-containing protein [Ruegeria lacuscaerulensis]
MISHKHRCLFVHVPKTAGKSVLDLFGLPVLGADYDGSKDWIEDPYGHIPVHSYEKRKWFKSYYKFAIVRHPLDRLVSAFHFLDKGGLNEGDRAFAKEHLSPYNGDFQKFVTEGLESAKVYPHFRPQSDWLCKRWGRTDLDYVGKFETLEESMSEIAGQIGLEYSGMRRLNTSTRAEWPTYFDRRTRKAAIKVYRKDFWCFNYRSKVS